MNTVKEWLETIADEDIRDRAVSSCTKRELKSNATSIAHAIRSFSWFKTIKDYPYWCKIHTKALDGRIKSNHTTS